MPPLPHAESAIIDQRKLREYCLSPVHPRGRHKARVFRSSLNIAADDAEWPKQALLLRLPDCDAFQQGADEFGSRWYVDVSLTRQEKTAVVRTI